MHARVLTMNVGPGQRDRMLALADESLRLNKSLPGFVSANYFVFDDAKGDYGSVTLWNSAADANAAGETLRPWLQEKIGTLLSAAPVVRHAEVYEPS